MAHYVPLSASRFHLDNKFALRMFSERVRRFACLFVQGDFFTLQKEDLADITDVFDRASLVALPTDMRQQYATKMAELLQANTRSLLVTLTYDQAEMNGPPFSVSEENVTELFSEYFTVQKLCFKDTIDDEPRMKERGLSSLVETVYKLTRNSKIL